MKRKKSLVVFVVLIIAIMFFLVGKYAVSQLRLASFKNQVREALAVDDADTVRSLLERIASLYPDEMDWVESIKMDAGKNYAQRGDFAELRTLLLNEDFGSVELVDEIRKQYGTRELFKSVINYADQHPDDIVAVNYAARMLMEGSKTFQEAKNFTMKFREEDKLITGNYNMDMKLLWLYNGEKDYDALIKCGESMLEEYNYSELTPNFYGLYGRGLCGVGRVEEGEGIWQEANERYSKDDIDSAIFYFIRMIYYFGVGDYDKCEEMAKKGKKLNPSNHSYDDHLRSVKQERLRESIESTGEVIFGDDYNKDALLLSSYYYGKNWDKLLRVGEAMRKNYNSSELGRHFYARYGAALYMAGNIEEAEEIWSEGLKREKGIIGIYIAMSKVYKAVEEYDKLKETAIKGKKIAPDEDLFDEFLKLSNEKLK